jgi:hypothetical protein
MTRDSRIVRRARILFRNGHTVAPPAVPALSPQDIEGLKFIARARHIGAQDGRWYQTAAALTATKILARHGIVTNIDRNTGRITFS